jgi:pyruvate dehydrogenase (quinone)
MLIQPDCESDAHDPDQRRSRDNSGPAADPRLIVAVLHNDDLNQATWEMRAMEGAPKFTQSQSPPDVDYVAFAASLGLQAIAVDKPDQRGDAWDRALSANRPAVLDVRTDPNVPPIPRAATW